MASQYSFITDAQFEMLLANGLRSVAHEDFDPAPVVKLFTPDAGATWLLTSIDPDEHDIAHGLCDLGLGFPEIGPVRLSELAEVRGMMKLQIEQDLHFRATQRLSVYAKEARMAGRIRPEGPPRRRRRHPPFVARARVLDRPRRRATPVVRFASAVQRKSSARGLASAWRCRVGAHVSGGGACRGGSAFGATS